MTSLIKTDTKVRSSYFFRQLLWSTLVVLVPVLVLLGFLQYDSLRTSLRELQRAGQMQAKEAARNTDRTLERINRLLDFLLTRDEVRELQAKNCSTLLAGFQSADLLLVSNVVLLDADGKPLCSTNPLPPNGAQTTGTIWYQNALKEYGRYLSDPLQQTIEGRPGVVLTDIVRNAAGQTVGMLVAVMDVERMASTLLRAYDLPAGSIVSVIDKDFRLMARNPEGARFFGTKVQVQPQGTRYLPDPVPVHFGVDKVYRVRATIKLQNAPWQVFVGIPVAGLVNAVSVTAWSGLAALTLSVFICFLVAWYNARRLSAPALQLAKVARQFGQGERQVRVSSVLPGEFGHVAKEFNEMADSIERLENERTESARIRAESEAKTRFLAQMSHELRTPLNALLGFSRLLQEETRGLLDETRANYLTLVLNAGQQLRGLIDDVLDMARIEAGQLGVRLRTVDPTESIRTAVQLCQEQASSADVTLKGQFPPAGTPSIQTDPLRLQQVLLNLLSNAVKYNVKGGQVNVSFEVRGTEAVFLVTDTGLGMSPKQLEKAFEPFNRLGRETSAVPGTGIGLTLARQLADMLNGRLELQSEVGVGTTAKLVLPFVAGPTKPLLGAESDVQPETLPSKSGLSGTVLYIEDLDLNVYLVRKLMRSFPSVKLFTVSTAAEGVALAQTVMPDVILLDMHLPDFSGLEVLKQLRALPAFQRTPIVSLSASAMEDEVAWARAAGATDYWSKPIEFDKFRKGMYQLLAKSPANSSRKRKTAS